jgi:hypothetical protein
MVEIEFNRPVDVAVLAEFFARCGWADPFAEAKLEWALAASEDWVVCRVDGELVGFGRSCRLGPVRRVVFDVVVDARYQEGALRGQIVSLLSLHAGRMEEVSVFSEVYPPRSSWSTGLEHVWDAVGIAEAPTDAYVGTKKTARSGGEE